MEIAINGRTDIASAEEGSSLGQILSDVRAFVKKNGWVVAQLLLDGKEVTLKEQIDLAAEPVARFQRLEVIASHPTDLAGSVLLGLVEMMPRLAQNVDKTADHLRLGKIPEAIEIFRGGLDGWSAMQDALRRIGVLLSLDYGQVEAGGSNLAERTLHLGAVLSRTLEAANAADFVSIGDILEYEIRPLVTEWEETLRGLLARVQTLRPSPEGDTPPAGDTAPDPTPPPAVS